VAGKVEVWFLARKKPIIVSVREVAAKQVIRGGDGGERWGEFVATREGKLLAIQDEDYVIKGVEGELYPINKKIFEKTYNFIICERRRNNVRHSSGK
jgi:hypothetical protein